MTSSATDSPTGPFPPMGEHAGEPHSDSVAGKLNALRAAVLGANDGIVSVAGLVMGVAGATVGSPDDPDRRPGRARGGCVEHGGR